MKRLNPSDIYRKICAKCFSPFLKSNTTAFSTDGEDLILEKYLSSIKRGLYIDIGSFDPAWMSNTFRFYLKGWTGICIDPSPKLTLKYRILRPRDLFINAAFEADSKRDFTKLSFYDDFPDNSTVNPERVDHLGSHFSRKPSKELIVPVIKPAQLTEAFRSRFGTNAQPHLLNIDIEGGELEACAALFSLGMKPWVICVEQLGINASNACTTALHKLVTQAGYELYSRTFLSSIYLLRESCSQLTSPYLEEYRKLSPKTH